MKSLAVVLLLGSCAYGKTPKVYPLILKIVASNRIAAPHDSGKVNTDCTNDYADHVSCTSTKAGPNATVSLIQTAEAPSDPSKHIDLQCRAGFAASVAQGAAAGGGATPVYGCQLAPGEYRARMVGASYRIQVSTEKGKKKEITLDVVRGPY